MNELRLSFLMLKRDWRSGELRALCAALIVAVAALGSVAFLTDRLERGLDYQANELLSADLVVSGLEPPPDAWRSVAQRYGLRLAESRDFHSMVTVNGRSRLAEVKAVSDAYPLRGQLRIRSADSGRERPAQTIPQPGTVWLDARLQSQLGARIGDQVGVGERVLTFAAVLTYEADQAGALFSIAPRLMMNLRDLPATGLIQPGSRVRYRLMVAGELRQVENFRRFLKPRLRPGQRILDVANARPEIRTALERARQFLGLSALIALVLAGAAVSTSTRRFISRHLDNCAVMRCLGARYAMILRIYAMQLLWLGIASSAAGCAVGFLAQMILVKLLGGMVLTTLPSPSLRPALYAIGAGLVTLGAFAVGPLLHIRSIPALRVIRRDLGRPGRHNLMSYGPGFVVLAVLMLLQAGDLRLGLYTVAATAVTLLTLMLTALVTMQILRAAGGHLGPALRFGIAAITRQAGSSTVQSVACGLGISILLLLAIVRGDLLNSWRESIPAGAPNHFVINIQPQQVSGLKDFLAAHLDTQPHFYPMVRGRLRAINGRSVNAESYDSERARRLVAREFNLSWAARMAPDNTVVAGRWWGNDAHAQHEYSVEQGLAQTLGIQLGDQLRFQVAGQDIEARVTSLRKVNWDSFNVNFFVLTPPGVLEGYPASYISAFYIPPQQSALPDELVAAYPNVTIIDTSAVIDQVRTIIARVSRAIEYIFVFTVAAGLAVLYAAVQSTLDERGRENAVLRALGATRRHLQSRLVIEFVILGLVAGVSAAAAASVSGYLLAERVFHLSYVPGVWLWIAGSLSGILGIALAGYGSARAVLRRSPLQSLRDGA